MASARLRWAAVRAIRMNYTRRGVVAWLRSSNVYGQGPGWKLVLFEPQRVIDVQHSLAEGAYL